LLFTEKEITSIASLLKPSLIRMNLTGRTKQAVIEELIGVLDAHHLLTDRSKALQSVIDRERQLSTGLENGLAVPHGKTDGVERLVAAFGLHREGLMFDAVDKQPAHFFFMMLSPLTVTGPHLQALREVVKFFNQPSNRERILKAATPDEILSIMKEAS